MDSITSFVNDNLYTIAFFLPILIGLVVKASLPKGAKSVVMILLTGVTALLAEIGSTATGLLTPDLFEAWVKTMIVTIASYYGIYQNIGSLGNLAPSKGIGPSA